MKTPHSEFKFGAKLLSSSNLSPNRLTTLQCTVTKIEITMNKNNRISYFRFVKNKKNVMIQCVSQ